MSKPLNIVFFKKINDLQLIQLVVRGLKLNNFAIFFFAFEYTSKLNNYIGSLPLYYGGHRYDS